MNINVGGGKFDYPGWLNLDERNGFKLSAECVLPEAEIVYSSHCLEHLDDTTVDRILSEARKSKTLVLKLPDFEDVLKRRAAGDKGYFKKWGQDGLTHMWAEDSLDMRASMIFCGYWNDAYGHEFKGPRRPNVLGAYHGPVGKPVDWNQSPHEIAWGLKSCAPEGAIFNHQNAWSRAELKTLLERHGFKVESMDAEEICKLPIPTVDDMRGISMYALAS